MSEFTYHGLRMDKCGISAQMLSHIKRTGINIRDETPFPDLPEHYEPVFTFRELPDLISPEDDDIFPAGVLVFDVAIAKADSQSRWAANQSFHPYWLNCVALTRTPFDEKWRPLAPWECACFLAVYPFVKAVAVQGQSTSRARQITIGDSGKCIRLHQHISSYAQWPYTLKDVPLPASPDLVQV